VLTEQRAQLANEHRVCCERLEARPRWLQNLSWFLKYNIERNEEMVASVSLAIRKAEILRGRIGTHVETSIIHGIDELRVSDINVRTYPEYVFPDEAIEHLNMAYDFLTATCAT